MIAIALRALYPKPNSTDSILSNTVIDPIAGKLDIKLALETETARRSIIGRGKIEFANIDAIAILRCGRSSRKPGAVWAPRMQGSSPGSPGSFFPRGSKAFALFAQHESRRT